MKYLSFFFVGVALIIAGCEEDTPPPGAQPTLRDFFIPIPGSAVYEWIHLDNRDGRYDDSLYSTTYIGHDIRSSVDGRSPIYLFQVSTIEADTLKTYQNEYYISDSIVIAYGTSAASDSERIVLLSGTLAVGKIWRATDKFKTADGIVSQIDAEVDAYYTIMHIGNRDYEDVYRITYRPTTLNVTLDTAYLSGARHVHYYARGIGKVLEMVYAPDSALIWKNELDLEH